MNLPEQIELMDAQAMIEAAANRNSLDIDSPNRATRREHIREMKRQVRNPVGMKASTHPLLRRVLPDGTTEAVRTPHGEKILKQRRAANLVARASRAVNRGGRQHGRAVPVTVAQTPKKEKKA